MRDFTLRLLASSALTALTLLPAQAGVLFESTDSPGFGFDIASARELAAGDIAVGDVNNYTGLGYSTRYGGADYFRLIGPGTVAATRLFNLVFTTSMASAAYLFDGTSYQLYTYYGQEQATSGAGSASSSAGGGEGSSSLMLQSLTQYGTMTTALGWEGASSAWTGLTLEDYTQAAAQYWVAPQLRPVLSFYDSNYDRITQVMLTEGNSVLISAALGGSEALYMSVSAPFDYTLSVSSTDVPEPGSLALLGLGAAGLAAARRRRRVI